ncbi:MAG: hypothetical protein LUG93_05240 [Lachnospiraceae bacterium]|nr:hypothetical protein [Lachnospiraceae bacterium]
MMESKMVYAPIYITTLCRDKHFIREMESLKKNSWASYTDIYIAVDYPLNDDHWNGYRRIIEYLNEEDFSVFASFTVIKREKNIGSSKNSKLMRDYILEKYDRWIYAEDDLEFSPNFIEYMDKCLMEFYDDEDVLAINGYSYPIEWCCHDGASAIRQKWTCSTWGIGHWKYKYTEVREKIISGYLHNCFDIVYKDGRLNKLLRGRYFDYITYALATDKGGLHVRPTDVAMSIYIGIEDTYVITPIVSKVRNYGFDGSGMYCENINKKHANNSLSYNYDQQPIDCNTSFVIDLETEDENVKQNKMLLNSFICVPVLYRVRGHLMLICYRVIGQERTCKLYQSLKKKYNKIRKFLR